MSDNSNRKVQRTPKEREQKRRAKALVEAEGIKYTAALRRIREEDDKQGNQENA